MRVGLGHLWLRAGRYDDPPRRRVPPLRGGGVRCAWSGGRGVALLGWPHVGVRACMGARRAGGAGVGGAARADAVAPRRTSPSATACSRSSCWARPSWRRRSRSRRWSTTAAATPPRCSPRSARSSPCSRCGGSTSPSRRRRRWCRTRSGSLGLRPLRGVRRRRGGRRGRGGGGRLASPGTRTCPRPAPRRPFTVPVVLYVVGGRVHPDAALRRAPRSPRSRSCVAVVLVAAATFTGQPVLVTGIVLALLTAAMFLISARAAAS